MDSDRLCWSVPYIYILYMYIYNYIRVDGEFFLEGKKIHRRLIKETPNTSNGKTIKVTLVAIYI